MSNAILKIAGPFRPADLERIQAGFCRLLKQDVRFDVVEAPELIGGFAAYIDGRVYDASILLQIDSLKNTFSNNASCDRA